MGDLFGDNEPSGFQFKPLVEQEHRPAKVVLSEALPIAHFLVSFARYQRGKFDTKRQKIISLAIQERIAPADVSAVEVIAWFTESLPKASDVNEPIEILAGRLQPVDIRIARRAALNITGPSQSPVGLACMDLIERLFPR